MTTTATTAAAGIKSILHFVAYATDQIKVAVHGLLPWVNFSSRSIPPPVAEATTLDSTDNQDSASLPLKSPSLPWTASLCRVEDVAFTEEDYTEVLDILRDPAFLTDGVDLMDQSSEERPLKRRKSSQTATSKPDRRRKPTWDESYAKLQEQEYKEQRGNCLVPQKIRS